MSVGVAVILQSASSISSFPIIVVEFVPWALSLVLRYKITGIQRAIEKNQMNESTKYVGIPVIENFSCDFVEYFKGFDTDRYL